MTDYEVDIEILRKSGIDPFKDYSQKELEDLISKKVKSWREGSQDSQRSESERKTLANYCEVANELIEDEDYFKDACESARDQFQEAFNERLESSCVLKSDGQYAISENRIEDVAEKIIKDMGWSVSYSPELITIDLSLYKAENIYRDARNIFNKLRKISTKYSKVEDWLNDLIGMEKLRVEGCRPLGQDCSFPEFKNAVDRIQDRFKKNAYKDMEARSNHNELLNLISTCVTCNESAFRSFRTYDGLRPVFEVVDQAYSRGTLNDLAGILRGIKVKPGTGDVIPFIEGFFLEKGYAFDFYGLDGLILSCNRCGAIYKDDGKITTCSKCGNILYTICPKCGARCSSDDEFCSECGTRNVDQKKLIAELRSRYGTSLNSASFNEAYRCLEEIERIDSRYEDLGRLKTALEKTRKRYDDLYAELDDLRSKKFIIGALKLCRVLKNEYPGSVENDKTMGDLERTKSKVDSLLTLHSDEWSKIDDYIAASQICADDPRISDFLVNHPPQPPRSIDIMASNDSVRIIVSGPSDMSNVSLAVLRKKNGPPQTPEDGESVSIGKQTTFIDKTITPGLTYYYSAFSIRGGVASSAVKSRGIVILPKADSVSIHHLPDCIYGEMTVPKEATGIHIMRSGDNGEHPISASLDRCKARFKDTAVKTGQTYSYSIVVQYGTQTSGAVSISHSIPQIPLLDLSVKKTGKRFRATVRDSGAFEVIVSDDRFPSGKNYLTPDDVKQHIRPKLVEGSFGVSDGYQGFVYAIRDMGGYYALSNSVPISSLNGIESAEYLVDGNDCTLIFGPPAKTTSILVRWSSRKMPSDSTDDDSESFEVPINNFVCSGNKIRLHVDGRYAYVELKVSYGGSRISDGYYMTIPISTPILEYSVTAKKKLFSKTQTAVITFYNDWGASTIDGLIVGIGSVMAPWALDEADEKVDIPELIFEDGMAEFSFEIEKERIPLIKVFKKEHGTGQDFALRKG